MFKDYAYKPITKKYGKIGLFIRLKGKERQINDSLSVRGGKEYDLFISFSSPKKLHKEIIIESLQLYNIDINQTIFTLKEEKQNFKLDGNEYNAYYRYVLKMPYAFYSIKIKFRFSDSNETYNFESKFTKDYQEEIITFWDQLMGV